MHRFTKAFAARTHSMDIDKDLKKVHISSPTIYTSMCFENKAFTQVHMRSKQNTNVP